MLLMLMPHSMLLLLLASSSATNTVSSPIRMSHQTSGTPAAGIGTGIEFETQTAAANEEVGATITSVATDVTSTQEDFYGFQLDGERCCYGRKNAYR